MVSLILTSESAQTEDNTLFDDQGEGKGRIQIKKVLKEMGGKEKKILNSAKYQVSDMSDAESKDSKCGLSDAVSSPLPHPAYLSNHASVDGEGYLTVLCLVFLRYVPEEVNE
ncbi:hypothetical protein AMELA_G00151640 [Ameiurus melas]|uniref:Uncharacterized protein n=1 Tax=Ameiurus melas TaxID=219545 RepID=A0A7J6AI65_AMEME|nr:hypothetical protein AMELA_G00151640 [Ameiurus melas]